jgi:formamidopyrimidine-DNA glycosylase
MPELPEVETVARDLRGLVVGATIVGVDVRWDRTIRDGDGAAFGLAIKGRRIESVGRRAKELLVALSGDRVLTIHLKMTGQLFVVGPDVADDPYVRVVIALDDGRELRFRDVRKFGRMGVYRRDPATGEPLAADVGTERFAALGPEPLDPAFTVAAFRRRLRTRRGRLKPLLLDQTFLAGVGNIYADEALWAARLHPLRSAGSLRPPDESRLYRELRRILAAAVERRGSSIDDYTAPEGDGAMQERLRVYQRAGEPCERCGRPIRRIVVGARATHFCSWCQRLPSGDRAAAATILRSITPRPGATRRDARSRRRGSRWIETAAPGTLGLTPDEAEQARTRAERTRRAAATRRAVARAGQEAVAGVEAAPRTTAEAGTATRAGNEGV